MLERFAIYYAPPADDMLCFLANGWYNRPELKPHTASARRYGFHATIKAPFALAEGRTRAELEAAVATFASTHPRITIDALTVRAIGGGFVALVPEVQAQSLTGFAGDCVVAFERFRAPLTAAGRTLRMAGLTPWQTELLDRYGYPYVMDQFQFHMTLTDKLPKDMVDKTVEDAKAWFAPFTGRPHHLDRLVILHEPEPGAPFVRLQPDYPLARR